MKFEEASAVLPFATGNPVSNLYMNKPYWWTWNSGPSGTYFDCISCLEGWPMCSLLFGITP